MMTNTRRSDQCFLFFRAKPRKIASSQYGFTLIELMVVIVVISLLALFAAPEISNWKPKMRLKGAAEELFGKMQLAKMHAIKNNVDVAFSFTTADTTTDGKYVFTDSSGSDVASVTLADGVQLIASDFVTGPTFGEREGFTPRGLPIKSTGGKVTLENSDIPGTQYIISQKIGGGVAID